MVSRKYADLGHVPLRHCATSRKVAGSIPDGVTGLNPFGLTVTLESTQPLTNEYQEYLLGGKRGRGVRLTTLLLSRADCVEILEALTS
jgi:hypothetical protein